MDRLNNLIWENSYFTDAGAAFNIHIKHPDFADFQFHSFCHFSI